MTIKVFSFILDFYIGFENGKTIALSQELAVVFQIFISWHLLRNVRTTKLTEILTIILFLPLNYEYSFIHYSNSKTNPYKNKFSDFILKILENSENI